MSVPPVVGRMQAMCELSDNESAELISLTQGLGTRAKDAVNRDFYKLDDETVDCLKDLSRCMRRDSVSKRRPRLRALFGLNILENNLVPIVLHHRHEKDIFFATLQLLVWMTLPPPLKPDPDNPSLEVVENGDELIEVLSSVKVQLMHETVLKMLASFLAEFLGRPVSERTNRDISYVEILFSLLVNLLKVPESQTTARTKGTTAPYAGLTHRFIEALATTHLLDGMLLIVQLIANGDEDFAMFNVLAVECLYHLFHPYTPNSLFQARDGPPSLQEIMKKEKAEGVDTRSRRAPTRHSKFGGCFVVRESTGKRSVIKNTNFEKLAESTISAHTSSSTHTKDDTGSQEESDHLSLHARTHLYQAAIKVQECCFNGLMVTMRDDLQSSTVDTKKQVWSDDFKHYYWLSGSLPSLT